MVNGTRLMAQGSRHMAHASRLVVQGSCQAPGPCAVNRLLINHPLSSNTIQYYPIASNTLQYDPIPSISISCFSRRYWSPRKLKKNSLAGSQLFPVAHLFHLDGFSGFELVYLEQAKNGQLARQTVKIASISCVIWEYVRKMKYTSEGVATLICQTNGIPDTKHRWNWKSSSPDDRKRGGCI